MIFLCVLLGLAAASGWIGRLVRAMGPEYTVDERLEQFEDDVRARLRADFERCGVRWPAQELALVAFKRERRLEAWVREGAQADWVRLRDWPVQAASGELGPKLREGDRQVPEGLYRVESLNPNSRFHLALRVSYPSEQDRQRAAIDGRTELGGDIMIHGSDRSVGCLAMGDAAAEELFVLVARAAGQTARVLIAPCDLRVGPGPEEPRDWVRNRYAELREALKDFPPVGQGSSGQ
ncbi:MAG: L,D-transpeptidase family protein [Planctomycetota bacterium]